MTDAIQGYGHIVLASSNGFTETPIRFFTSSKFSHALVTMPPLMGVPMCAEDSGKGVDMLRFDTNYLQNPSVKVEVWSVNVADEAKEAGLIDVVNQMEQPYGYLEVPWFVWRWVNLLFGRDIKSQDNWSQRNSVCSGLVRDRYVKGIGLGGLWDQYGRNSVCPQDLRDVMAAHPELFTLVYSNV